VKDVVHCQILESCFCLEQEKMTTTISLSEYQPRTAAMETESLSVTMHPVEVKEEAKSDDDVLLKLSSMVSVVLGREGDTGGTVGAASDDGHRATMDDVEEETGVLLLVVAALVVVHAVFHQVIPGVDDRTSGCDHTARGCSWVVMTDGGIPEEEGNENEGDGDDGEDTGHGLDHPVRTAVGIHPNS